MNKPDLTLGEANAYKENVRRSCDAMIEFISKFKADTNSIPETWLGQAKEMYIKFKTENDSSKIENIQKNIKKFESIKANAQTIYNNYVSEWNKYDSWCREEEKKRRERQEKQRQIEEG